MTSIAVAPGERIGGDARDRIAKAAWGRARSPRHRLEGVIDGAGRAVDLHQASTTFRQRTGCRRRITGRTAGAVLARSTAPLNRLDPAKPFHTLNPRAALATDARGADDSRRAPQTQAASHAPWEWQDCNNGSARVASPHLGQARRSTRNRFDRAFSRAEARATRANFRGLDEFVGHAGALVTLGLGRRL